MYYDTYSVDALYDEGSHSNVGFPASHGFVAAPIILDKIADCPIYSYAGAADNAAVAAGIDLGQFQHKIYILPQGTVSDCTWLAIGNLGSYGSSSTYRAWSTRIDAAAIGHELGHNLGWHHAATDTNNNGYDDSEASDAEYADTSDMMGYCCTEKKFNAVHLDQIGWLQAGSVLTVTGPGDYSLAPLGSAGSPQVLKIDRPANGEVYYLSYRQPDGLDGLLSSAYTGGVNIHYGRPAGNWSYFIQTLGDGGLFEDAAIGLTVSQSGHDASGVQLSVSFDSCVTASPSVAVTPDPVVQGATYSAVDFTVTVHNNDLSGCGDSAFGLSANLGLFADGSLTVAAGGSASSVLTVDEALADGLHSVVATASRSGDSGSGSATLQLDRTPPSAPPSATAEVKKVKGRRQMQISWTAADDGPNGTGVVRYDVSRADGSAVGSTSGSKLVDSSADLSNPTTYSVRAVDAVNNVSDATIAGSGGGGGGSGGGGNGNGNGKGKNKP